MVPVGRPEYGAYVQGDAGRSTGHPAAPRLAGLAVMAPIVVGSAAAILAGAWDYLPFLVSPWFLAGLVVSGAMGLWFVRRGTLTRRDLIVAFVLGLVGFALGWLAVLLAIVLIVLVIGPLVS